MCTIHVILPTKEVATFDATEAMITVSMYDLEAVVVNYVGESVIGYGHKSNSMEQRQPRTATLNPYLKNYLDFHELFPIFLNRSDVRHITPVINPIVYQVYLYSQFQQILAEYSQN